jgi:putative membrane protein
MSHRYTRASAALALLLLSGCAGFFGEGSTASLQGSSPGVPPSAAVAPQPPPAAAIRTTAGFVQAAAVSDLYEVQSSRLASMKTRVMDVRRFADMMIADHTATTTQLMQIVSRSAPTITPPMQPDARRQALLAELMQAQGPDFDRRYVMQQINAHREALMLMEGYAQMGDNAELRQFASATAPKIRMHLDMILDIANEG